MTDWPKKPYRWHRDGIDYVSVSFTYHLPALRDELLTGGLFSNRVVVGGPAVRLMPTYLAGVPGVEIGWDYPGVLQMINPDAFYSTEGCPNKCGFCGIRLIQPTYRELDDWPDGRICCDNNLLAASRVHFDKVIDGLRGKRGVDFNQGLDARLLTSYQAGRLSELDATIRLAWDNVGTERHLMRALELLKSVGIPKSRTQCYVLIGYKDTPEDALYRLETLVSLGVKPNPMRYTPLDSVSRNYVGENWTDGLLRKYMRYWSNLRATSKVPFAEFGYRRTDGGRLFQEAIG